MTMFEELFALACSATLTMTVSADEKSGRLTVNVIPKPRQDAGEPEDVVLNDRVLQALAVLWLIPLGVGIFLP